MSPELRSKLWWEDVKMGLLLVTVLNVIPLIALAALVGILWIFS
jgi:hypothetical protein